MKSLFVRTADADALYLVQAVLKRVYQEFPNIRPFNFDVQRFGGYKDAEIAQHNPDFIEKYPSKNDYDFLLAMWDYHGSGDETRKPPANPVEAGNRVQGRLDKATWHHRSGAIVLVPELEEWVWHDPSGLCDLFKTTPEELAVTIAEYASARGATVFDIYREQPKELLCSASWKFLKRKRLQAEHFEIIGSNADLHKWRQSPSFSRLVALLQTWFPA